MSTPARTPFSPQEWALLAYLLGAVAEQLSYRSCVDYPLDASAEHKALVAAAIERVGTSGDWADEDASWQDYVAAVMAEDEQIVTFMDWMAGHLGARCRALADGSGAPMERAELALIADMLDVAREDHDDAEALGLVPYAIETSDENRGVLADISDEQSRPPGQETSVPFKAALIYFAQRCGHLPA